MASFSGIFVAVLMLHFSILVHANIFGLMKKKNCPKLEQRYRDSGCLENRDSDVCRTTTLKLLRRGCTLPCVSTCNIGQVQCSAVGDCPAGNELSGLCGENEQCCISEACPTDESSVTCEDAATCTGAGTAVEGGFYCPTASDVCCTRLGTACPTSNVGVSCEAASTCAGDGISPNTAEFFCPSSTDVCCFRECPTNTFGYSCDASCGGFSFELFGFACPNSGDKCCESFLG